MFLKKIFKYFSSGLSLWKKAKNHDSLMKMLRVRIVFSCVCCLLIVGLVSCKLVDVMVISNFFNKPAVKGPKEKIINKADIVDRNGYILATSITTASCYADPSVVIDIEHTATELAKIPGMPCVLKIKQKLKDKSKHFVWIARHVTPVFQQKIMNLGLPGIAFQKDYKRIYPNGSLCSHVVGFCDVDGNGVCGIEKEFNAQLAVKGTSKKKLRLTIDAGLQFIVREEIKEAVEKFHAIGGNAILMDIKTGEILSMVSLPDFDPCDLKSLTSDSMFNRNTLGVYEAGSTFKILNVAIALETESAKINSMFDATCPIKLGRFSISDFRGKNRALSLAEAFVFSSNIAAVKIQQTFGHKIQKEYMKRFGVLDKISLEIPEKGAPILPQKWSESAAMTISYGYGVAISPMQQISVVASIVNSGKKVRPTLLYDNVSQSSQRVVSEKTSAHICELMRAVMVMGTGRNANVEGMGLFGKTGTAYKISGHGYGSNGSRARRTTFLGGFPYDDPKYILIVILDEPKAVEGTYGYATAGYNAAPTAKNIFQRIAPILMEEGNQNDGEIVLKISQYIHQSK